MEDFLLIQRMKLGDEQAIDQFVRKYYETIYRYCLKHVRNVADGEDLTQETFVRFFRSFDRYQHYGKVKHYLYTIAANLCRDYYKACRETPVELPEIPECGIENLDTKVAVYTAMERLPPKVRETAELYFIQELPQKEIAKTFGIGLPLVKYRIKRARELLTEWLREEED